VGVPRLISAQTLARHANVTRFTAHPTRFFKNTFENSFA